MLLSEHFFSCYVTIKQSLDGKSADIFFCTLANTTFALETRYYRCCLLLQNIRKKGDITQAMKL